MTSELKALSTSKRQVPLSKNSPISWLHLIIVLLFMFFFKYLPPVYSITSEGMAVFGVFLGLLWGWSFCGNIWPSLLGIIAIGFSGYMTLSEAFTGSFANNNFLMLLFMFVFLYYLSEAGITQKLVYGIINMKFLRGRPWLFSLFFLWAAWILQAIVTTPGMLIAWAILYDVWKLYKVEKGKYTQYMVAGVAMVGVLCGQAFPFAIPVVNFMSVYEGISGDTINALTFTIYEWITNFIYIVLYILVGRFIFKFDLSAMSSIDKIENEEAEAPWTTYQKIILILFLILIVMFLWTSFMPKSWAITSILSTLGTAGIPAAMVIFLIVCNFNEAPNVNVAVKEGPAWGVLFMVGAVAVISNALGNSELGIAETLNTILTPVFGNKSTIVFLILVTFIPAFLTSFCNNLVLGMIFIPIAYSFAISNPAVNSAALAVQLMSLCSIALMTPAGCVPSAIFHSNSDYITSKQAMFWGFIAMWIVWIVNMLAMPIAFKIF